MATNTPCGTAASTDRGPDLPYPRQVFDLDDVRYIEGAPMDWRRWLTPGTPVVLRFRDTGLGIYAEGGVERHCNRRSWPHWMFEARTNRSVATSTAGRGCLADRPRGY